MNITLQGNKMSKEKLKQALEEDDQSKVTDILKNSSDYDKTYILIISSLSDLSFKEDKRDYQNALTLLDRIGYSAESLKETLKGWNLFARYGFTEDENDTTLARHSEASESKNGLEEHLSDDETDHSTSPADNREISGDVEEFFPMDD